MKELTDFISEIVAFRDERDWKQFHSPRHLSAALSIESGELQETMLWKSDAEVTELLETAEGRSRVSGEVADVLIFALLFCHETEIDPAEAIRTKLSENRQKYPVRLAKGNAAKYTDFK